jgi:hypothetical protein
MDGSTASLIAIPIVATLVLAAWLLLVAYAATHPQWKHGTSAAAPENPAPENPAPENPASAGHQIRSAEPRPADLAPAHAGQHGIPGKPAKLAA